MDLLTTTIYILKLTQEKYYIGKSNNATLRIQEHFNGGGTFWTKLHKPIEVLALIPNSCIYDEDKYTLEFMDRFGIDNVRGGTFSNMLLSDDDLHIIHRLIWSAKDLCFACGGTHFVRDCHGKKNEMDI